MKKKLFLVTVMALFVLLFAGCAKTVVRVQIMFPNRVEEITVGQELRLIPAIYGGEGTLVFTCLSETKIVDEKEVVCESGTIISLEGDLVTGLEKGKARVLVYFAEDESVKDELEIIVTEIAGKSMVIVSPGAVLIKGETLQLNTSMTPSYATKTVAWSSSDASIATVDEISGLVSGVEEGTAVITATSTIDANLFASYTIKVNNFATATSIVIKNTETKLFVGETLEMTFEANPLGLTSPDVIWSVGAAGDTGTATITSAGILSGITAGEVTVIVKDPYNQSIRATYTLLIKYLDPVSMEITAPIFIKKIGETVKLSALVSPTAANQAVVWESSDNAIATISAVGLVEFISFGDVTITAKSIEDETITATYTITDIPEATGIVISFTGEYPQENNGTLQLVATVSPATVPQAVIWSSSNETAATVDPNTGLVTRVNIFFDVIITAKLVGYPDIKAEYRIQPKAWD